jgi:shikimate dehydrogenase
MRRFGLIGRSLKHSFSPRYFSEKFFREGIQDCSYEGFPLPDLNNFEQWLKECGLVGFNVTIPYKEEVIPYLHELDAAARDIGAVNCVHIKNGRTKGYNTDVIGIQESFNRMGTDLRNILLLGTGGAAKAVRYVAEKREMRIIQVGRDATKADLTFDRVTSQLIQESDVIVNTTPLGTFPDVEQFPPLPYAYLGPKNWLFDLVYNPEKTAFLRYGTARGARTMNGMTMLIAQAEASWGIWNPR